MSSIPSVPSAMPTASHPATINWNHILVYLALLSLLSFAGLGNARYRWLTLSLQTLGFGCAVSALLGYREDRQQGRVYGHQAEVLGVAAEVSTAYQQQLQQLHGEYGHQLAQWEAAYQAALAENAQLQQTHAEQQTSQQQECAVEAQRLDAERQRLDAERQLMWQHIEAAQEEIEQQQAQLAEQQAAIAEREAQFERDLQARIADEQAQLDQREAQILAEFETKWAEREAFFTSIANDAIRQYEASKTPEFPKGVSHEELLARDAIRCLEQWSIIAKKPIVTPGPGKRFSLSFEVFPVLEDGTIKTAIRSVTEALKLIQKEVLPALKMAVPSCSKLPSVKPVSELRLELAFDISGVDWEAIAQQQQERQRQVVEPSPQHLIDFVQHNPHINLMADSGHGKTTLLNNLTAIARSELGPRTTLIGVNPKPDEGVDYATLKYIGFEESIYGLLEAAAEIYHRVETNNQIIRANRNKAPDHRQSLPTWSPILYLIDEYTELMGVWNNCKPAVMEEVLQIFYSKLSVDKRYVVELITKRVSPNTFAGDLTKICWRVGRSENVKLIIAGQNLKANVFKVNIQDIQQQAYIYAGQAILEGIDHRIQPWHKEMIKEHYALREHLVLAGESSKYYGLFVPKEGVPYFAGFPPKGEYCTLETGLEQTSQIEGHLGYPPADAQVGIDGESSHHRSPPDDEPPGSASETLHHLEACWDAEWKEGDEPSTDEPPTSGDEAVHRWATSESPPVSTGGANAEKTFFNPLEPSLSHELVEAVMVAYLHLKSQNKVIETVWNIKKAGKSRKYRAAKHHFRHILNRLNIVPPGKPWGKDPDDHKPFKEIIA